MRNKPLPRGLVVFGEVGLAGEIRPAPRGQERFLDHVVRIGLAAEDGGGCPKCAVEPSRHQCLEGVNLASGWAVSTARARSLE